MCVLISQGLIVGAAAGAETGPDPCDRGLGCSAECLWGKRLQVVCTTAWSHPSSPACRYLMVIKFIASTKLLCDYMNFTIGSTDCI